MKANYIYVKLAVLCSLKLAVALVSPDLVFFWALAADFGTIELWVVFFRIKLATLYSWAPTVTFIRNITSKLVFLLPTLLG